MTMRGLIWISSDICRLHFEHLFRVFYLSLAALGLQAPVIRRQPCPGFLIYCVARGTPHASTYNNENTGALGRYSAEDGRGA